jgi:hypothetical protein
VGEVPRSLENFGTLSPSNANSSRQILATLRYFGGCAAGDDETFYRSTEQVQSAPCVDKSFADLLSDLAANLQKAVKEVS